MGRAYRRFGSSITDVTILSSHQTPLAPGNDLKPAKKLFVPFRRDLEEQAQKVLANSRTPSESHTMSGSDRRSQRTISRCSSSPASDMAMTERPAWCASENDPLKTMKPMTPAFG